MTHGFGGVAIISVLDALNAYVHETLKYLDRNFGIPNQNVSAWGMRSRHC